MGNLRRLLYGFPLTAALTASASACLVIGIGTALGGCKAAVKKTVREKPLPPIAARTEQDGKTGITWVQIQGGAFNMGSRIGRSNKRPIRKVQVKTFWMAKTATTVAQYRKCVDAGRCKEPVTGNYRNWGVEGRDDHPINGIMWQEAADFCAWAGARLPSEAEWEYAARSGGGDWLYPWGDAVANCDRVVWSDVTGVGCGRNTTWPVCSKKKGNTRHGLCDMSGNVWEWVQDNYHENYEGAPDDGSAWENPDAEHRVIRGGSFYITAGMRAAHRDYHDPAYDFNFDRGFRCAK